MSWRKAWPHPGSHGFARGLGMASPGPGGGRRGKGQPRGRACAPDGGSVGAKEGRAAGRTRVGSGLCHHARVRGRPRLARAAGSAPAPARAAGGRSPGLRGARQPLPSPPLRSPRFRRRPGGSPDRGRAAPSARARELPPPPPAHPPRPGLREWRRRAQGSGRAPETLAEQDAGRVGQFHSRVGRAPRHLRPPGDGTRRGRGGGGLHDELGGRTEPGAPPSFPGPAATWRARPPARAAGGQRL